MNLLLLSGSFHSTSKTIAILRDIQRTFDQYQMDIPELDALPFYCEDLAREKPQLIRDFLLQVEQADGILICTPEYNHSIPAVLKNAIDWVSRPAFNSPLKGKPVSFITQAASPVGGARAQAHLKLVLDSTLSAIYMCHEMMISDVDAIFDRHMNVSDAQVRERLSRHVSGFVEFIEASGDKPD